MKREIHPPLKKYMNELRGIKETEKHEEDKGEFPNPDFIICDGCSKCPIGLPYFHCTQANYDLCLKCYKRPMLRKGHTFSKVGSDTQNQCTIA